MTDTQPAVLDEAVLDELVTSVGDDREFVNDLARTFLADAAGLVAAVGDAARGDDAEGVVRPAHTLKSSSATLGCMRLASVAREIEMRAREGAVDASAHDGTLDAAWDDAAASMGGWLERADGG